MNNSDNKNTKLARRSSSKLQDIEANNISKEKITVMLKAKLGLSAVLCEEIINHTFAEIIELLKVKNKLSIKRFGSFEINHKKARPGFNLQTGEKVIIKPRKVVRFVPSKSLKEVINDKYNV